MLSAPFFAHDAWLPMMRPRSCCQTSQSNHCQASGENMHAAYVMAVSSTPKCESELLLHLHCMDTGVERAYLELCSLARRIWL
eukprot:2919924-Pleurochrysis_carterae.AAC.1